MNTSEVEVIESIEEVREQTFAAAAKTLQLHVCLLSEFSMFYKKIGMFLFSRLTKEWFCLKKNPRVPIFLIGS